MTYMVVTGERYEVVEEVPTVELLSQIMKVEGSDWTAVEPVQLSGNRLNVWVNGDFAGHFHAGRMQRNLLGTVLAISLGGAEQPYAGPVVLTGATFSPMEGRLPADLPGEDALTAATLLDAVLALDRGEDVFAPPQVRATIQQAIEIARTGPFTEIEVLKVNSIDEFLGRLG